MFTFDSAIFALVLVMLIVSIPTIILCFVGVALIRFLNSLSRFYDEKYRKL